MFLTYLRPCHAALLASISVVALSAGQAQSAAIERLVPAAVRILYEEGRYVEFGTVYTDPDQSGEGGVVPPPLGGPNPVPIPGNTGDVFEGSWTFSGNYKADINDRLSYAVLFDTPFGADTNYTQGFYSGTSADLNTFQLSAVLSYDVREDVKIFGGLRAQQMDADAKIPFVGPSAGLPGYSVSTNTDWGYGYLLGAAYERPDIALRVALTYFSSIEHDFSTKEFGGITIPGLQSGNTRTDVETPQSASLEFQTGVAADTLLFGSIRWVDWSEFAISPPTYTTIVGRPLVDYPEDWWTYSLGVGRQVTDALALSASVTYEPSVDEVMTTLGPYDGRTTGSLSASYDFDSGVNLSGGVTYGVLGDTTNILETDFNDGSVWGAGLRIGYSF